MKKWTKKEEDYLRDNTSQTNRFLAKKLKRSEDSIARKRSRLDVSYKPKEVDLTPADVVEEVIIKQKKRDDAKLVEKLAKELNNKNKELDALLQIGDVETYTIKPSEKDGSKSNATAIALLSDWHYEENVKTSQVNGLNKYNTDIAKERAEKLFRVISQLVKVHNKEYTISNLVLALLGDFISGSIHDDLKESNNIQPTEAIYEVQCLIASGIKFLLKETNVNLIIPCSSGNHARITEKQRVSTAYGNSLEFLMYRHLRDYFENEPRVKFIINDSYLTYVNIYGYTARFHHGDSIRFSGGVGGIFIPAFKAISQWNKSKHADWDFFGHFHQMKDGGSFITNGSLIGYNGYAIRIKADYEKPKQAFVIIDEERGLDVVRKITL